MTIRFKNDEVGYLQWVQANPKGYVVNVDEPNHVAEYPMVHRASHKLISSPQRSNYTTAQYVKYCGGDLDALERWSLARYGKPLVKCRKCM